MQDISNALQLVDNDERFSQIIINELADGNPRAICSTVWQFMQIYWKRFQILISHLVKVDTFFSSISKLLKFEFSISFRVITHFHFIVVPSIS